MRTHNIQYMRAAVIAPAIVSLLMIAAIGCAPVGKPGAEATMDANPSVQAYPSVQIVQAGDFVALDYRCWLQNGEIVAATNVVSDGQPKSTIFSPAKEPGPQSIIAMKPDEAYVSRKEDPFEFEILNRLGNKISGMRSGETRTVLIEAQDVPARDPLNYTVEIARVRTRPKEARLTLSEYREQRHADPVIGQPFTIDPDFPGKVEEITEQQVVVRYSGKPGAVIRTAFGPGVVRDEGANYRYTIDARKGGLVRVGGMVGRITQVDEKKIAIDFRNPFGFETLACDVAVYAIASMTSSTNDAARE